MPNQYKVTFNMANIKNANLAGLKLDENDEIILNVVDIKANFAKVFQILKMLGVFNIGDNDQEEFLEILKKDTFEHDDEAKYLEYINNFFIEIKISKKLIKICAKRKLNEESPLGMFLNYLESIGAIQCNYNAEFQDTKASLQDPNEVVLWLKSAKELTAPPGSGFTITTIASTPGGGGLGKATLTGSKPNPGSQPRPNPQPKPDQNPKAPEKYFKNPKVGQYIQTSLNKKPDYTYTEENNCWKLEHKKDMTVTEITENRIETTVPTTYNDEELKRIWTREFEHDIRMMVAAGETVISMNYEVFETAVREMGNHMELVVNCFGAAMLKVGKEQLLQVDTLVLKAGEQTYETDSWKEQRNTALKNAASNALPKQNPQSFQYANHQLPAGLVATSTNMKMN